MKQLHIITPVKDSIELTLQTIESILSSDLTVPYHYYVSVSYTHLTLPTTPYV